MSTARSAPSRGDRGGPSGWRDVADVSMEAKIGKRIKPQPNGCWLWTGPCLPTGYGTTTVNGVDIYAHRFVYETLNGPIPKGFVVHHECETPACCNPAHLTAMSPGDHVAMHAAQRRKLSQTV